MNFVILKNGIDPCINYYGIRDSSRSITVKSKIPLLCDTSLPHQWYRFDNGESDQIIPTKPIKTMGVCGTISPGWMRGSLPTGNIKNIHQI